DTALRTADSGYLTRRLVDVSHNVIVREDDCFAQRDMAIDGMLIRAIDTDEKPMNPADERLIGRISAENIADPRTGEIIVGKNQAIDEELRQKLIDAKIQGVRCKGKDDKPLVPLGDRIIGRYTAEDVYDPETGELIVGKNQFIDYDIRDRIIEAGIDGVRCRTVFTCRSEHGVCAKCYGMNCATGQEVTIGEAVGIIAAQAIGEPGTQLTMRTFHTGGVATAEDITQGLPRVEEIFEARKPKGLAVITEIGGTVELTTDGKKTEATVRNEDGEQEKYLIPFGATMKIKDGDRVEPGDVLTAGSVNPHDILKIKGVKGVQAYMLKEVQAVYRNQGVEISDKHIEVIIRQMLRKVRVETAGDTDMLPGELVDIFRFEQANDSIIKNGGVPAAAKRTLLGITKASLATDSFLSAASFQETTRVLTEAAIKGKVDPLVGLKENVIIGKLIPAGIGMKRYRNVQVEMKHEATAEDEAE
ncbi:MAG: DNA-directed RNA polymerase subunit beta', partial [Clostridia bacterium]|nr:DNA-directed RNA polymerase subunit beta' [Clostridia bacterium]